MQNDFSKLTLSSLVNEFLNVSLHLISYIFIYII
jgi:hypothetical protein